MFLYEECLGMMAFLIRSQFVTRGRSTFSANAVGATIYEMC